MTAYSLLNGLHIGTLRVLEPEGQMTGMFKSPVASAWLDVNGFHGDVQADRRFHGGPDKAVHHFPVETYAALEQAFPALAGKLGAGMLGENLSTRGIVEQDICIGDVFQLGDARLQMSQPRNPCWKINHRLDTAGASAWIANHGKTGWYYRVLASGQVRVDDKLVLIERVSDVSLQEFWQVAHTHRPQLDALHRLTQAAGLAGDWQRKLAQRLAWLSENGQKT